jgi:hypothetical protein
MTFDQWNGRVDATANAIARAADDADWMTVNTLVAEFAEILNAPLADPDPRIRDVFVGAQGLIARILETANDARESARNEIQQITKGRKAVAAYR